MKADVAEYREFRLVVSGPADGPYNVRVVESPAGQAEEPGLPFPLDPLEAQSALASAARATEQWVQRNVNVHGGALDPLRDIGSRLFSWLFGPRLINFYRRSLDIADAENKGLRLRLVLQAGELTALPWEFLHDGSDFLVLSNRTPLVREVPRGEQPAPPLPVQPPLRVLVVSETDATLQGIHGSLSTLREQGEPLEWHFLDSQKATWNQLLGKLAQEPYHVLYYMLASSYQEPDSYATGPGRSALALVREEGGRDFVPLERWMELLRDNRHVRLVHLGSDNTSGFAASLSPVVQATLGVAGHLTPYAHFTFTLGLYRALLAGKPLEAAVTQGRREIDQQILGSREWGLPTFYMQTPTGEFLLPAERTAEKAPVSGTRGAKEPPANPKQQRRWKLLQSQLAIAQRNLAALQQQRESKSGSPALVDREIESTKGRIADLEQQLDKMAT
jgi:hypothetical protein